MSVSSGQPAQLESFNNPQLEEARTVETAEKSEPEAYHGDDDDYDDNGTRLRMVDTSALEAPVSDAGEEYEIPDDQRTKTTLREKLVRLLKFLRPYYILDYLDWSSTRIVIRSWVKSWVCALLTLIQPSNMWFGQASYLLAIYSFVVPCGNFSIAQSLMFGVICTLFACLGWMVSVISLAISCNIRGNLPKQYYIQQVVQQGICPNDATLPLCFQTVVFEGTFLDSRTSVIHVIGMMFGLTFFVFLKLKSKVLVFGGVVGIITLTISSTYGVYFPYFEPTNLGFMMLRPMGITFAFNVVAAILLFPKTSNFSYYNANGAVLRSLRQIARLHHSVLKNDRPSMGEFSRFKKIQQAIGALGPKMFMIIIDKATLAIEVSFGRFDKKFSDQFSSSMDGLVTQMKGFEVFYQYISDCRDIILQQEKSTQTPRRPYEPVGKYEEQQREWFKNAARSHVTIEELDTIMDAVESIFGPTLEAADRAFAGIIEWLNEANHFRTYTLVVPGLRKKYIKRQAEQAEKLAQVQEELMSVFGQVEGEQWRSAINSYFKNEPVLPAIVGQGCLFGFLVRKYVYSLDRLMYILRQVDQQLPTPKLCLPSSNRIVLEDTKQQDAALGSETLESSPRDPESDPPTNAIQRLGKRISTLHHALGDHHFVTALRTAFFAVALSLPAYFTPTAHFFYANRAVWATIMASLATYESLGDTVYATISNFSYTFLACVIALIAWYMGNGHGTGNPYGMGAVYGVLFLFLVYYRHFSQHLIPLPSIIFCVTIVLVLGTSWQDTHYPQTATLNYGWEPAWKRFVEVIVGLSVGAIASIFPKPYTVKKMVRRNLGNILTQTGKLHCDVGNFAIKRSRDAETHMAVGNADPILRHLAAINGIFADTRRRIRTVRFEPPLSGKWPKHKYLRLLKLQADVVLMYQYLHAVFNEVEDPVEHIPKMVRDFGWTDPGLNSDFLAILHMSGSSLVRRTPLPALTPAQTTVKLMKLLQSRADASTDKPVVLVGKTRRLPDRFDFSKDGRLAVAGMSLIECIYERIDEIALLTKELVGENYNIDPYYYDESQH